MTRTRKTLIHKPKRRIKRDPSMRYISRVENDSGTRGWLVRVRIGPNLKTRFVADSKEGSKTQALATAKTVRNKFLRQHVAVTLESVIGE